MSTENAHRRPLSESEAEAEARRIIEGLWKSEPIAAATSFRDTTPTPPYGTTPPVHQDDHRIVPAWAAGVAVVSIGVGAGITGIGCGVWLACQGFAAVTLTSVLFVTLPIAAVATEMRIDRTEVRQLEREAFSKMRACTNSEEAPAPPCKPAAALLDPLRNGGRELSPAAIGQAAVGHG